MRIISIVVGAIFCLLTIWLNVTVWRNFSPNWQWWVAVILSFFLLIWSLTGFRDIAIGWKAQLTFFGARKALILSEGLWWIPWPLGIMRADTRETSMPLEDLEVLSKDNINTRIKGSIVYKITNLHRYFDVDPNTIQKTIKENLDEKIRTQVVIKDFEDVKKMHVEIGEEAKTALEEQSERWGMEIITVPVTVEAVSTEAKTDLELKAREKMQQAGQMVETLHFCKVVAQLMKPLAQDGANMGKEEAILMAKLIIGKGLPQNTNQLVFDSKIMEAVAKIAEGRR